MSNQKQRNNQGSILLSDHENEAIFSSLGRSCVTLATGVVQLYLAEAPNRQRWNKRCCGVVCFVKDNPKRSYFIRLYDPKSRQLLWEQELYNQFRYKTPREYFHTFEAHDCQAALNFASEDEANGFKCAVEGKLMERHKKRMERKKRDGQPGAQRQMPKPPPTRQQGTISVGSGPPPAQTSVTLNRPTPAPVVSSKDKKSKGKDKGKPKKLTKDDISTPTDFRHVSHVGWDPNTGLDMQKLDPHMKNLFEQIGITDQTDVDEETIDFIYDFVDKHGGIDAVREDLARRHAPPPAPSHQSSALPPPPPASRAPSARPPPPPGRAPGPPPPPERGSAPPPPPPGREGMSPPPPPPARQGHAPPPFRQQQPPPPQSRMPSGPPPPPMVKNNTAAPPPPPPPPAPAPPPPPPAGAPMAPPPPSSDRSGLLADIHKGATLKHVTAGSGVPGGSDARGGLLSQIRSGTTLKAVTQSNDPPQAAEPQGIVGALAQALALRKNVIQDSDDDDDDNGSDDDDDDEWDD